MSITFVILWGIILVVAALLGLLVPYQAMQQRRLVQTVGTEGWIYFLSTVDGEFSDPPSPIKIGMTHRDPEKYRLPEIQTMSPEPLRVLWSFKTQRPEYVEVLIHHALADYRRHGEWFDRDATLMYISHLRGEV